MHDGSTGKASHGVSDFDGGAFLFACIITLCTTASTHLYIARFVLEMKTAAATAWTTPQAAWSLVLVTLVTFVVSYALCHLFFRALDRAQDGQGRTGDASETGGGKAAASTQGRRAAEPAHGAWARTSTTVSPRSYRAMLHRWFWRIFLLIVICWLPWLIAHLPGAFDDDTVWQLVIWRLPEIWNDHHPFLTTALFGGFLDLGRMMGSQAFGLMLYSTLQVFLTAGAFSALFCYLRRFDVPCWLFRSCLVLVCILPPFASYAGEMVKESVFCWPWLLFCIVYVEAVRTRGKVLERPAVCVGMLLLASLMALSKKTGIFLACLPLLVLLFLVAGWRRRGRVLLLMAIPVACLLLWSAVLLPSWGVSPGEAIERYAIPLQQTARTVITHADDVTAEEREAIDAVVPYDRLAELYDPVCADRVKEQNRQPSSEQLDAYLKTWAAMGVRHPLVYLEAACDNAAKLYLPLFALDTKYDMSAWFVDDTGTSFSDFYRPAIIERARAAGDARGDDEIVAAFVVDNTEGLVSAPSLTGFRDVMNGYEYLVEHSPLLLVDSFAFMVIWVPLSMLCYGLRRRWGGSRRFLFCLIPSFVLYLTLIASPTIISRYCIVAAYIFPLVLSLPFVFERRTGVRNLS